MEGEVGKVEPVSDQTKIIENSVELTEKTSEDTQYHASNP